MPNVTIKKGKTRWITPELDEMARQKGEEQFFNSKTKQDHGIGQRSKRREERKVEQKHGASSSRRR